MGNAHTKESRDGARPGRYEPATYGDANDRSGRRSSRRDLNALDVLTGGPSSTSRRGREEQPDAPFERRETKQEREARRLERERVARLKEREQSMKEEHVDGGFLVTMGVYTASEDFSKPIVRQLQIDRKIAPFWRGLDDFEDNWAEHQIIAAARGLDIPPADQVPEGLVPQPRPAESPSTSLQNLNNLTVPMGPRTLSAASDRTASNPGSALPSPTSPAPPQKLSSSLKNPHKTLANVLSLSSSRNASQQDIIPREISLPNDPFVNGQPLEVFLYKDGIECPICVMYYPRYLNKTRCCDQYICSECFVQIKRPDPHLPEHHPDGQNGEESRSQPIPEEQPNELIMEAACCPYCTQTEFGVTYEPPPFRRGLTHEYQPQGLGRHGTAMSSSSSLGSNLSPTSATTPAAGNRRRAQSLSANDPSVISTDRIRPDWTTKLSAARQHQRRRAAAADALHHAAFVMNQSETSRSIFGRSSRFGRMRAGSESPSSQPTSNLGQNNQAQTSDPALAGPEPGARTSSVRTGPTRERIDAAHLESMMMAEAIRLSLADEEDRRKKAEKEAKKEAKKKEKEERKANKHKSNVYGQSENGSSASSSTLSLGFGRKRTNTAGSQTLRAEASVAAANAAASQSNDTSPTLSPVAEDQGKGKEVERDNSTLPIPISQTSRGSSHLRHMSNASSISSASGLESLSASYNNRQDGAEGPTASQVSLNEAKSEDEGNGTESMFNFRSLGEMIGVPIDGEQAIGADGQPIRSALNDRDSDKASQEYHEHVEHAAPKSITAAPDFHDEAGEASSDASPGQTADKPLKLRIDPATPSVENEKHESGAHLHPPSVMITPETPAPQDGNDDAKQLGHADRVERPSEVTQ
ncbi:hypothetical protein BKA67DRAFT_527424 [Truncatella angustata]|uniref:Protein sip5 n=1 Tax=Truncatella angustata TaxID=152316 RepID=A0A9P8RFM8_9PEZI|nr:uncharacterized protein BKA67DRAFT_527424 [Truncatella angustata]KAH6645138.1 hypothetical protein BKA67DRAFT_527424 [Truncatella angustata]KAH8201461.1 hypothetical protein TruAng_004385 [Truncatella angustata]